MPLARRREPWPLIPVSVSPPILSSEGIGLEELSGDILMSASETPVDVDGGEVDGLDDFHNGRACQRTQRVGTARVRGYTGAHRIHT